MYNLWTDSLYVVLHQLYYMLYMYAFYSEIHPEVP